MTAWYGRIAPPINMCNHSRVLILEPFDSPTITRTQIGDKKNQYINLKINIDYKIYKCVDFKIHGNHNNYNIKF